MQALLGKITSVTRPEEQSAAPLKVAFKAACILPQRTKIPEWLQDQALTIERTVRDPREVGHPGDSIVLTPAESARWLFPLEVTPSVAYGRLPETLRLDLRWWKEEKAPEFTVRANGRCRTGQFVKDGESWTGTVEVASLFDARPVLPVTFEITCDKLKAACAVLPEHEAGAKKLLLAEGEVYRIENDWYAADVLARSNGGGIASLREKGRGNDHFRVPENVIQPILEYGGHADRFRTGWGWSDQMRGIAMTSAGARREGEATRLSLEGLVDEGQGLRTSVVYTLFDAFPLLHVARDYQFHKAKEGDSKDKDEQPKEPIDEMRPMGLGFRAAWRAERDGHSGSRVLCAEGDHLVVLRGAQAGDMAHHDRWTLADGWAMAEHPGRREQTLYLFDPKAPPYIASWLGRYAVTLEPFWPVAPVRPEQSVGYSLAMTAGELCGARAQGAWVACRTKLPDGRVRCAVISRLRDAGARPAAEFSLAGETKEAFLEKALLPGVGHLWWGAADFPAGQSDSAFDVTVAEIASRR